MGWNILRHFREPEGETGGGTFARFAARLQKLHGLVRKMEQEADPEHAFWFRKHLRIMKRNVGMGVFKRPMSLTTLLEKERKITKKYPRGPAKSKLITLENQLDSALQIFERAILAIEKQLQWEKPLTNPKARQEIKRNLAIIERDVLRMKRAAAVTQRIAEREEATRQREREAEERRKTLLGRRRSA